MYLKYGAHLLDFPLKDVRMDLMEATDTTPRCPYKGKASYRSARIGDRVFEETGRPVLGRKSLKHT